MKNKKADPKVNDEPIVFITKKAYEKAMFLRDNYDNEISAFGILQCSDPIIIEDIAIVKQECDQYSTDIDDEALADYFEDYIDKEYEPWQIMRTWIHTHPRGITSPSFVDNDTFARCFNQGDWGIMIIFVKSGEIICDIHINKPFKMKVPAEMMIIEEDHPELAAEVNDKVTIKKPITIKGKKNKSKNLNPSPYWERDICNMFPEDDDADSITEDYYEALERGEFLT